MLFFREFIQRIWKKLLYKRNKGAALIVTVLVLLILTIVALAILLLSDTEYLISVNEQDSIKALTVAEGGIQWAKMVIQEETDFSDLLDGPDDTDGTADDNLIGLGNLTHTTLDDLLQADPADPIDSARISIDGLTYEALAIRNPGDATNVGLVFIRIDDNQDDFPSANAPLTDTDQRMSATVLSEYPVILSASGGYGTVIEKRGPAKRKLVIQFGPASVLPAILTDQDLDISGNPIVCGACGSVHANGCMDIGGNPQDICENATAFSRDGPCEGESDNPSGCNPTEVLGDCGFDDEIDVPTINPYDPLYVPAETIFDTSSDAALAGYPDLQCSGDPAQGSAKYFAFLPGGGPGKGRVFKAYWNAGSKRWDWKLIDTMDDGINPPLDDCGRAPGDADYQPLRAVNDTKDDEFYGLKMSGTAVLTNSCSPDTDASLSGTSENDYNPNTQYYDVSSGLTAIGSSVRAMPHQPKKYVNYSNPDFDDGQADFDGANTLKEGDPKYDVGANKIYSPLYNAVVFFYGQLNISGNPGSNICTSSVGGATGCSGTVVPPAGRWRISMIAVSSIEVSGQMGYSGARAGFDFGFVSGRDVKINGNPAGALVQCDWPGSPCTVTGLSEANSAYASIILAHEQLDISGDFQHDGFMIAESAIDCNTMVDASPGGFSTISGGNPRVHYDCEHPPNPFGSGIQVLSWQEVQ